MDLLSCWCPYPNSNVTKKKKKSVSYQAKSLGLQRAAEGDMGFLFMRLKYIKDLCFAFLYHRPVEVSRHLGNLLPRTVQDEWQQLLQTGHRRSGGHNQGRAGVRVTQPSSVVARCWAAFDSRTGTDSCRAPSQPSLRSRQLGQRPMVWLPQVSVEEMFYYGAVCPPRARLSPQGLQPRKD